MGNDVLERRAVKERGGKNVQGVEPATSLTDVFHDEVSRVVAIEPVCILKGIVHLSERHGARVEPHV